MVIACGPTALQAVFFVALVMSATSAREKICTVEVDRNQTREFAAPKVLISIPRTSTCCHTG